MSSDTYQASLTHRGAYHDVVVKRSFVELVYKLQIDGECGMSRRESRRPTGE